MSGADAARAMLAEQAPVRKVVGPRLKRLLYVVFALLALLGANSVYLAAVSLLGWITGLSYENLFYLYMFLAHLALGLLLIVPFVVFGFVHMFAARGRRNRRAVRVGYALLIVSLLMLLSGVVLIRVRGLELRQPLARSIVYWMHVISPLLGLWLYWLHRLAGTRIHWRLGLAYLGGVGAVVGAMVLLQAQDPRRWNQRGPAAGDEYFEPSLTRTSTGKFIPQQVLMADDYCLKCHKDAYDGWFHSAHHFSSFNNPAYLPAVRETRRVLQERTGSLQASRWCAGCHDPVPFLSGAFDNPQYDDVGDPTSQAGITCTACHAITHVNSNRGNGDYVIEEPLHYPFTFSENPFLQWLNETLVRAKPQFHKKTFLKPFHLEAEFCSTCHKVHLPKELNNYKEFIRGQNHYDSYLLSGVSGHGARSFYYPDKARENCSVCHMPLQVSNDFGARPRPGQDGPTIHNHLFPAANTGVAWFNNDEATIDAHKQFLADTMRVDLFGVREGFDINGELHAPLRPTVPTLRPGGEYLLETVIRTLKLGHHFTQGTVDSNEVWLEVKVTSGGRVLGHSGGLDAEYEVDPRSHFVNVFMLDRDGRRIARRNPQDIFVPLYNHQIPPGAGQTVHYKLRVPDDVAAPIRVELRLNYRKFDKQYIDFMARSLTERDRPVRGLTPGQSCPNPLPIVVLAEDVVVLPVEGVEERPENPESKIPEWQRWNDYGIGMLLKDTAEIRPAAEAFAEVERLGRYDGPLNLARALLRQGNHEEAAEALRRAAAHTDPAPPPWTVSWLSGSIDQEQGRLAEAQQSFFEVLNARSPEMIERGFDFSLDYVVRNSLGQTLFDRALQQDPERDAEARREFLTAAAEQFHKTLEIDSENVAAHHNLHLIYDQLGDDEQSERHRQLHERYKPDDNAGEARRLARLRYPDANRASEALVFYDLPTADEPPARSEP